MLTEERFSDDVKNHSIKVLKSDGPYRHLRLSIDGNCRYWFELVTWPHHLCINGDMGTFTFSRVEDMFKFFRSPDDSLYINLGYWAEKCTAGREATMEYSEETFRVAVNERFFEYTEEMAADERNLIWEQIKEQVLCYASSKEEAYSAAYNFNMIKHNSIFDDFYEVNCDEYTPRYTWCCYAIVWAIKQYDKI